MCDRPTNAEGKATTPAPTPLQQDETARAVCDVCRELLAERVPITLILDLAMPSGPHSAELLELEGLPAVQWWAGRAARTRP